MERKSDVKFPEVRKLALDLYLEGFGFWTIWRVLGISYGTAYQWIKRWGSKRNCWWATGASLSSNWTNYTLTYSQKNTRWIWTAVDRLARKHIAFVCGDRSGNTGSRLKEEIRHLTVERFFSDYWKAYAEMFPADKLKQTKTETYTIEGYNCRIRHYLTRFKRKRLCRSKSENMIVNSLNLLFLKLNNKLSKVI